MFTAGEFLPLEVMARITEARVSDPERPRRQAERRIRRERVAPRGKLNIVAADHPARRVTKVGSDNLAMADRHGYLARMLRVLVQENVDGLLATMDILEDLLTIDSFIAEAQGRPVLDGKVLLASLNRGGVAGTVWEMDDPMTGPTPADCAAWRLDGTKILLRVADDDRGTLETIEATVGAINQANALAMPTFLEPLPMVKTDKGWSVKKDAEALARLAGVASALGDSSRYMWLKLPYCPGFEMVARSTSLPILLLGGESAGDPAPFLNELASALKAGPNVRGALVGRNVLYPGGEDPLAMAAAVAGIVHDGLTSAQAMDTLAANRGRDMDFISRQLGAPAAI
jgi:hypothetical protein